MSKHELQILILSVLFFNLSFYTYCEPHSSESPSIEERSKKWKRVYLASFPRSGNHWIRYLTEEASAIATSAVYCDKTPQHLDTVFPWGGYCCDHGYQGNCRYPTKKDRVLIKTHFPDNQTQFDRLPSQCVIRIIRHPVDSFYSRYEKNPHGSLQNKVPSERVKEMIKQWNRFQTYWNKKSNTITIRYEDILDNPHEELRKLCKILKYDVTDEDIVRAINKYPPQGTSLKHINKFSKEDLCLIYEKLGNLMRQFHYPDFIQELEKAD